MNTLPRLATAIVIACCAQAAAAAQPSYTVVISKKTHADASWKQVVAALTTKYPGAAVVEFDKAVADALPALKEQHPRFTCFVATPAEATREFVAQVHRLTRQYDNDPYTDTIWGVLTGFDAGNALRIAQHSDPLTIHKVASGTEVALEMCEQGVWYCELNKNKMVSKSKSGEAAAEKKVDTDTTKPLVDTLNDYKADLFVTSGHATERDWQIGYRYRNGYFKSGAGKMWGEDTAGNKHFVASTNPKVYLPIGNCLMGHIDSTDAMALAWMNSAGVNQMAGYTVLTWYGYAGWGCLDYFVEQPGRYTFAEAFFANQHAMIHRLETFFPENAKDLADLEKMRPTKAIVVGDAAKKEGLKQQDGFGLIYDRDTVAFYGDPGWIARMAPPAAGALAYEQTLTEKDGTFTLDIKPNRGEKSFEPVNKNGAQRGWRPIVAFLPKRVDAGKLEIVEGKDLNPTIADDFVLVPNPKTCDPAKAYRVVFRVK